MATPLPHTDDAPVSQIRPYPLPDPLRVLSVELACYQPQHGCAMLEPAAVGRLRVGVLAIVGGEPLLAFLAPAIRRLSVGTCVGSIIANLRKSSLVTCLMSFLADGVSDESQGIARLAGASSMSTHKSATNTSPIKN